MNKGGTKLIITIAIFLAVLILGLDPVFAAIRPIGITQEALGEEIRDEAANRYKLMTYHGRYQENLGRAIRDNSLVRMEWNVKEGMLQENLGRAIRDDAFLRFTGAGNLQEEIGRAIVSHALGKHKLLQAQTELGVAIREEASTKYDTMVTLGKYQERLGEAFKMDAVTRYNMGLNQEEISVPVGEDGAFSYTASLLVGMTVAACSAFFLSWAIYCPKYEGEKAEEKEAEIQKAA